MMRNGLRKIGIAQRQQWALLQVHGEKAEPQTDEGDGNNEVEPGGKRTRSKFRPGHPIEIHQAHEEHPTGNLGNQTGSALDLARQQNEERQAKAEDQNNHRHYAPAAIEPRAVERNFFRLVAGPDDEQLGEVKIGPEHVEGEEQLGEIVEVTLLDDSGERLGAGEQHNHDDHQAHGSDGLAANEDETVNGGGPMGREGHNPIDSREGHRQNIQNDSGAGEAPEVLLDLRIALPFILLFRPGIEKPHQQDPDREVKNGAAQKTTAREIALLKLREGFLFQALGIEPGTVERLHTQDDGNEHHEYEPNVS